MLNIKLRTEYSFRTAYGPVKKVILNEILTPIFERPHDFSSQSGAPVGTPVGTSAWG